MSLKRPRSTPQKLYKSSQGDNGEVPLLRIHVVSARGLPRSSGAVGMPDPYVVVKFNGDKVGATKPDRKTRRPEWNQNFLIRSDLPDPNVDKDSGSEEEEGEYDAYGRGAYRSRNRGDDACVFSTIDVTDASGGKNLGGKVGKEGGPWAGRPCGSCRACRRRKIEVVLEIWHSNTQKVNEDIQERSNGHSNSSSSSNIDASGKPDDLFDDRLFDLGFVSRCFRMGALRRVHGAVIGGNKLIGVCRISSRQLRALGSSTLPADLAIRDPRGSWWSSSRGTIRVAVSLEQLQASIIRATLSPSKVTQATPPGTTGVWSALAGVSRKGHPDGEGEGAFQPADFFCKVLWNGQDFSSPSQWHKIFCLTQRNDQLWIDVRATPEQTGEPSSGTSAAAISLSRSPTGTEHGTDGGGVLEASENASLSSSNAVTSTTMASVTTAVSTLTRGDKQRGESRRQYQWNLTRRRRGRREQQPCDVGGSEDGIANRSCVLKLGKVFRLSTFGAQGLADMLNSVEEWTQRMAGTKEWHEQGFRVHWDGVRRRFTILNVSKRSFVLRGSSSSLATELLGFGERDYMSQPVAEALLDPQQPSDPPRRHMAVTADHIPPPLLRPHWVRIIWGPPSMEIARGGEFEVQIWARQPVEYSGRLLLFRHRRRRTSLGAVAAATRQGEDGSWLVGTAVLNAAEVFRLATGDPTWLPLLSPRIRIERHRNSITNGNTASGAASVVIATPEQEPVAATTGRSSPPSQNLDVAGLGWAGRVPSIFTWQRQRFRRLMRRIAAVSLWSENGTPVGVGGAEVHWGQTRPRSIQPGRGSDSGVALTPTGRGDFTRSIVNGPRRVIGRRLSVGDVKAVTLGSGGDGVVGHVWVSLKLRDPSMLVMRAVRQWNMARDEASVQQRRAAQVEAKRLWMLMPGISLWRILVQLAGVSLLVSYCVTLALRAYHSTNCRATFNCKEETDPTLASLREWQMLADNLLSAMSFLDMLLQFRTAYVDNNSKIITDPKKVAVRYLRTWFVPDLWCSLPYVTMQPLLQPLLDELEDAADSLSQTSIAQQKAATEALSRSVLTGADSPLSLFVYRLSKRLHIPRINRIRGTRAFKHVDDAAMGVDLTVKQIVHVLRGRRKLLDWLGNAPKRRGRIRKFFFRVGLTNKWTRIVLSYRLLGYVKVIGTLLRAMRVLAVAIRAVPRAARVLRLMAVFVRSYEGRRRSKDLHEASIVIQRRTGRHLALKVAGRFQANLKRRARASSESALTGVSPDESSDAAYSALHDVRDGSPIESVNGSAIPTTPQSSPPGCHGCAGKGNAANRARRVSESDASEQLIRSDSWSDCGLDEVDIDDEGIGQSTKGLGLGSRLSR